MSADLRALRRTILETAHHAREGHIASAFSILEIVWTLYDRVMGYLPIEGKFADRLILSKGHGCLALYAVLAEFRVIPNSWLATFCQPAGQLMGHPSHDIPGVAFTTGSLGHGLPLAVGLAYGLRLQGSPVRVFCLVGDTEMEEGSCWEALHLAARFKLANLTLIVDNNQTSPNLLDGEPYLTDLAAKFRAFGWFTSWCDGHDCAAIERALQLRSGSRPFALIANTIKGRGIGAMQRDPAAWHHKSPNVEQLAEMLAELAA